MNTYKITRDTDGVNGTLKAFAGDIVEVSRDEIERLKALSGSTYSSEALVFAKKIASRKSGFVPVSALKKTSFGNNLVHTSFQRTADEDAQPDEISIEENDIVIVKRVYDDNWGEVYNVTSKQHGVIPLMMLDGELDFRYASQRAPPEPQTENNMEYDRPQYEKTKTNKVLKSIDKFLSKMSVLKQRFSRAARDTRADQSGTQEDQSETRAEQSETRAEQSETPAQHWPSSRLSSLMSERDSERNSESNSESNSERNSETESQISRSEDSQIYYPSNRSLYSDSDSSSDQLTLSSTDYDDVHDIIDGYTTSDELEDTQMPRIYQSDTGEYRTNLVVSPRVNVVQHGEISPLFAKSPNKRFSGMRSPLKK
jgi:hypothetical protein